MATIKLGFRPSDIMGAEGTIYYKLTHRRQVRVLSSGYHLMAENWSAESGMFVPSGDDRQQAHVRLVASMVNQELRRMAEAIAGRERARLEYTADELLGEFRSWPPVRTLFSYMRRLIESKRAGGRAGTASAYRSVLHSLMLFRDGCDLTFDMLTHDTISQYEGWLRARGVRANSSSSYMRVLRAVYRMAVRDRLTPDCGSLFSNVYMGYAKTRKRALPAREVSRLAFLCLPAGSSEAFARDLFLLSIYLRGMSFVDMAFLRKDCLVGGMLTYSRMKTRQTLSLAWEPCMQEIVNRYASLAQGTPYLLPIITHMDGSERQQYLTALRNCNRALKRVGDRLSLQVPLTTYVARHTWASMAQEMHVPLQVIQEGMGHESLRTTQVYLASIDARVVDGANQRIIDKITRGER